MKKLLSVLLIFASLAFAYQNRYTKEQVIKDFNSGNTAKYHDDHLQELNFKTLQQKGILSNESLLTNNSVTGDNLKSLISDDNITIELWITISLFYSEGGAI